jgi:hypothetical protein
LGPVDDLDPTCFFKIPLLNSGQFGVYQNEICARILRKSGYFVRFASPDIVGFMGPVYSLTYDRDGFDLGRFA